MNQVYIKKSDGSMQLFSVDKLRASLEFTGASPEKIEKILEEVMAKVSDGISTQSIYKLAFKKLRQISRPMSAYYGTKRALLDLGPEGYHFERFIARMMGQLGYETKVGTYVEGRCISHEIDVIAQGHGKKILIECKFHNTKDKRNDIKTALYVKARSNDVFEGEFSRNYDEFWLVSNTSFSDVAIRYATCSGLHLWGANFPPQYTLQDVIRDKGLDSITCLSTLHKAEKNMLIESDIYLAKELLDNKNLLSDIGLEPTRISKVLNEIKKIQGRMKK